MGILNFFSKKKSLLFKDDFVNIDDFFASDFYLREMSYKDILPTQKDKPVSPQITKTIKNPILGYYSNSMTSGRGELKPPEYDLTEITRVEDVDSYVRKAFEKKTSLMFKSSWEIVGKDQKIVDYVKLRFKQMELVTGKRFDTLLKEIGASLVKKHNAFLVKVRNKQASGGKIRTLFGTDKEVEPVAGYFLVPAETFFPSVRGNKIIFWRQYMPDGDYRDFQPEDVIHIYKDRKDGFIFGTPDLIPVLDDLRALRKIEENVELLIYQHLFPLYHMKVGTDAMPVRIEEESGLAETVVLQNKINNMPSEAGLVTDHRVEINAIGAAGRAIAAEGYLDYFKRRVLSGLGISEVDMGEASTSNKSTADRLSQNLIDSVKSFQFVLQDAINQEIVNELLLEANFKVDIFDSNTLCYLSFKEIDLDKKIKVETHYADLFAKDVITYSEARIEMGREPYILPSPEEVRNEEDTQEKYPEWVQTHFKLFRMPQFLIQSIDEPYTKASIELQKMAQQSKAQGTGATPASKTSSSNIKANAKTPSKATVQKTSQVSSKNAKKKDYIVTDNYVQDVFNVTKKNIVTRLDEGDIKDLDWLMAIMRTELSTAIDKLQRDQIDQFRKGYLKYNDFSSEFYIKHIAHVRSIFNARSSKYINKLIKNIISSIKNRTSENMSLQEQKEIISAVFDSYMYRTRFIEDVELNKAYNFGVFYGRKSIGEYLLSFDGDEDCKACSTFNTSVFSTKDSVSIDNLPPFHASCGCTMSFQEFDDLDISDAPEEKCILAVKRSMRKEHPNWSEQKIKSSAYAICRSKNKK